MSDWKTRVKDLLGKADDLADTIKHQYDKITGPHTPTKIVPYLGYGTARKIFLNGRVLRDRGTFLSVDTDTSLDNLRKMYKRFKTAEVRDARVRARFHNINIETNTDKEGYFSFELHPEQLPPEGIWHNVELELVEPAALDQKLFKIFGRAMVPPPTAQYGVISDIDDTVIWTNVTSKLKMIFTIALLNARTRLPFKGVAAFYRALQCGLSGNENNPIFYVSSGPWNLFEFLMEFFEIHGIPLGPIMMKDFGEDLIFTSKDHGKHKMSKIEPILQLYPELKFILIGDSGEQDPEIYHDIVVKYPDRIRAIYIRNVNPDPSRIAQIDNLIAEVRKTRCQLILTPDSEFAAAHAAGEGLISLDALNEIRSDKKADESSLDARKVLP